MESTRAENHCCIAGFIRWSGKFLFDVARTANMLFEPGTVSGDLPGRFMDPCRRTLMPDLRLIAPDLRPDRTQREVMGARAWKQMGIVAEAHRPGSAFVICSVPLLSPSLLLVPDPHGWRGHQLNRKSSPFRMEVPARAIQYQSAAR